MPSIYELTFDYRNAAKRLASLRKFKARYEASEKDGFRAEVYVRGTCGTNIPFADFLRNRVKADMPTLLQQAEAHYEHELLLKKAALRDGLLQDAPDFTPPSELVRRVPAKPAKPMRHPSQDELDDVEDE